MQFISTASDTHLIDAAALFCAADKPVALTGAGISVGSGIPDFRSPGGVWTRFAPNEYATIDVFLRHPDKAWKLYREMGRGLLRKKPNKAHVALAELEKDQHLKGIITQNVDNLHQQAGSELVFEIHGDHQHLHCLQCDHLEAVRTEHYSNRGVPQCPGCAAPLKPNVVLFGEPVRSLPEIESFIVDCDLLLVIGTSAQIYPAAALPGRVKQNGGRIFEFNREPALGAAGSSDPYGITDYFFRGDLGKTLPMFAQAVAAGQR